MLCSECGRGLRPVVSVDIDGVLGNYHKQFLSFSAIYLNQMANLPYWLTYDGSVPLADWMGIPKPLYRQVKLSYRQGGTKRWMEPFKDAPGFMMLLRDLDAEDWITTTRPYMRLDNIDPDTQEWLDRNYIKYDGLIYDEHKYERLVEIVGADRIVAVLEDQEDQYDNAERLGLHPILRRTSFNRSIRKPRIAENYSTAYSMIEQQVHMWYKEHGRDHR